MRRQLLLGICFLQMGQTSTRGIDDQKPETVSPEAQETLSAAPSSQGRLSQVAVCPTYCATEYFHQVPAAWEVDFRRVMSNLTPHLGFFDIDIIAWPSSNEPPSIYGRPLERGQYISGRKNLDGEERTLMVLEIPLNELKHQHAHRLSVIAHEYFHVYQRHHAQSLNHRFNIKWLIEGAAAVFESMYLNDYEQIPDYHLTAQLRHAKSEDFGARMEHYDNPEVNYGTSTAMVLLACKETGFQGIIDFWNRQPTNENWKNLFKEVFGVPVEQFYEAGKRAPFDQLSLEDMGKLEEIRF